MKKVLFRMFAYLIDIIVVGLVITVITVNIPAFKNKEIENYNKEYTNIFNEYIKINEKYETLLEDKVINEDEYNEIKNDFPNISLCVEKYVGEEVDKEKLNEEIMSYAKEHARNTDYKANRLSLFRYIFELIITILYFGVVQFLLKGQTLGKKLFRINVVNESDSVPSLRVLMIRSLFTSTIVISLINSILSLTLSYNDYSNIYNFITSVSSFYIIFMFAIIVFREDGRGLHDMLLKTHIEFLNKETDVKTLEYKEKENEKSTNKTNRNVSKRSSK